MEANIVNCFELESLENNVYDITIQSDFTQDIFLSNRDNIQSDLQEFCERFPHDRFVIIISVKDNHGYINLNPLPGSA